jgi:hypothetical protein
MVVIVGNISGVTILDLSRRMRIGVPDRLSLAVFVPGALNLVRRGSHTPVVPVGK